MADIGTITKSKIFSKPMNPYLLLGGAIVIEVIATTAMKSSDGFSKLVPSLICGLGYIVSFYLRAQTLKNIPTGIASAIWSGVGIVLISRIAWMVHGQKLDWGAMAGMALIVGGVAGWRSSICYRTPQAIDLGRHGLVGWVWCYAGLGVKSTTHWPSTEAERQAERARDRALLENAQGPPRRHRMNAPMPRASCPSISPRKVDSRSVLERCCASTSRSGLGQTF